MVVVLLLLLSGDVETNPGPDGEVLCSYVDLYGIGCEHSTTTLVVHGSLGHTGRAPIPVSQIDRLAARRERNWSCCNHCRAANLMTCN